MEETIGEKKVEWNRELAMTLIDLWEENAYLCDTKHKYYSKKHARYDALSKICEKIKEKGINITQEDIKVKINNLRADYWKSNERKFCEFCKCWIADNKPSVSFHENGKRHKANVAKRITEISRNCAKQEKEKQKMDQEIRKMEDAALRAYANDVSTKADITARSISTVVEAGMVKTVPRPGGQVDPLLPPGDFSDSDEDVKKPSPSVSTSSTIVQNEVPEGSMWVEAKSPEGYTYYWNVKTNKSIWEPPKEGFMPLNEYERINQIAIAQQQLQLEQESKTFQESATEVVAKYNRERLKMFRRPDVEEIKKKAEQRATYKTEEEIRAPKIGEWQPVVHKQVERIDLELPKQDYFIPQVVSNIIPEPSVKRFAEKTVLSLDTFVAGSTSENTFKKRKISGRGNARQRLDVD